MEKTYFHVKEGEKKFNCSKDGQGETNLVTLIVLEKVKAFFFSIPL